MNFSSDGLAHVLHLVFVEESEAVLARFAHCAHLIVVAASRGSEVVNNVAGSGSLEGESAFPASGIHPVVESHIAFALDGILSGALARFWAHGVAVGPDECAILHHLDREAGELVADHPPGSFLVEAVLVVLPVVVAHFVSLSLELSIVLGPLFEVVCAPAAHLHAIQVPEVEATLVVLEIGEARLCEARAVAAPVPLEVTAAYERGPDTLVLLVNELVALFKEAASSRFRADLAVPVALPVVLLEHACFDFVSWVLVLVGPVHLTPPLIPADRAVSS